MSSIHVHNQLALYLLACTREGSGSDKTITSDVSLHSSVFRINSNNVMQVSDQ